MQVLNEKGIGFDTPFGAVQDSCASLRGEKRLNPDLTENETRMSNKAKKTRWVYLRAFVYFFLAMAAAAPLVAAQKVELSVDTSKAGAKIDRNIFGQFAEHLGHGIYEGIWVGTDSKIPNTRGIRNDVVAALKALKVPKVRWPGGCFADEYHWRKGIGAQRPVTLNPNWGGVTEPNAFGTHEFLDFLEQIGSDAYVSINVGSGTPQEASEWLEYMTTAQPTTLAKE